MGKLDLLINVLAIIAGSLVGYNILIFLKNIRTLAKNKAKLAKLEANKCKGAHKWITMKIKDQSTHVCRECHYTPVHDGFVKDFYVEQAIFEEKYEQNYKEYFNKKIEELSSEYKIDLETLKEISEKIVNIKKDHSSVYLQDLIKEITQDIGKESE